MEAQFAELAANPDMLLATPGELFMLPLGLPTIHQSTNCAKQRNGGMSKPGLLICRTSNAPLAGGGRHEFADCAVLRL